MVTNLALSQMGLLRERKNVEYGHHFLNILELIGGNMYLGRKEQSENYIYYSSDRCKTVLRLLKNDD